MSLCADSGEEHHAEAEQRFSALQALVVLLPDAHREALRLLLAFTARLARLAHRHQVPSQTHTHTHQWSLSLFLSQSLSLSLTHITREKMRLRLLSRQTQSEL